MEKALERSLVFPDWKQLANSDEVSNQICIHAQFAQELSFLIADARVWRTKLRLFREDMTASMLTRSRDEKSIISPQLDKITKLDLDVKDMIICLQERLANSQENVNNLKLISRNLLS
jgi:hypothetical protein